MEQTAGRVCISKKGPKSNQMVYTQGPNALTELSLAISNLLKLKEIGIVIVDSISGLLIHNKDVTLVRFLHDLVNKTRKTSKKLVFIILSKDNKGAMASVPLFMDSIAEF